MPQILRVNVTEHLIGMFVKDALKGSMWFEVTPLSEGWYQMAVKDEPSFVADALKRYALHHSEMNKAEHDLRLEGRE